ncbi:halocyanin domain-containing protein [Halobaculum gomorrense]|uniref:Halocyanin domain-containing protein n=1 Tax=Halobaculum gomorrense TaxID=43928 RepID=A0A1M5PNI1_9EURY|nr:halocyanin domain-containing protein [Halobaculum gomorrense]
MSRRSVLRSAVAGGVAAAAGGAASTPAAAQSGGSLAEWFSNTDNYDGVVDRTGQSSVTVEVGVEANGGYYGFGPAAVRVDPGTTVTWEWTGQGSTHNVVAEGGAFESELVAEAGHTFEHAFESAGVYRYACTPHKPLGMKGAVVVGDAAVSGSSGATTDGGATAPATTTAGTTNGSTAGTNGGEGGSGNGGTGSGGVGDAPAWLLLGGGVAAALSPLVFGLFLLAFDDGSGETGVGYRTETGKREPDERTDGGR